MTIDRDRTAGPSSGQLVDVIRHWSTRLLTILFGTGLAWLLVEVFVRIAFPLFPYTIQAALREVHVSPYSEERLLPPQIWQADKDFQFVSRSNIDNEMQFPDPRVGFHVTTMNWLDPDSHVGFRVPSNSWEPRWPVDVVVVGDSFAFCYTEYADCWVDRLDAEHGLSSVNLGLVATGSTSHMNVLTKFGLLYEPHLVIWQWYGNDFNDDYGLALVNGELEMPEGYRPQNSRPSRGLPSPTDIWLERNSAVYWLYRTISSSAAERYVYERFVDPYEFQEGELRQTYGRPYTIKAFDMSVAGNQTGRTMTFQTLRRARDLLTDRGIPLVVVLVPTKEEVYRRWTEDSLGKDGVDMISQGRLQLRSFCDEEDLLCVDVTDPLTTAAEQRQAVYWPDDTHLNELGNQILADAVWEFLVERRLVAER